MNLQFEIISKVISDAVNSAIKDLHIVAEKSVDSVAVTVLNEIKSIINDENIADDFDVVERIVCIFEKYNIDSGSRHDF